MKILSYILDNKEIDGKKAIYFFEKDHKISDAMVLADRRLAAETPTDAVGKYIGDDSNLMLNLQTVRKEFSKECKGKAWVIVTSQQDVDSIMKVK